MLAGAAPLVLFSSTLFHTLNALNTPFSSGIEIDARARIEAKEGNSNSKVLEVEKFVYILYIFVGPLHSI